MTDTPPRGRLQSAFPKYQRGELHAPVLDDGAVPAASDYPWTDDGDPHDTPGSRRYWIEQYQEQLAVTQALRSDLSGARFERDIWWPLAFCVGVLCGLGFQWFA
jgi:hypothetical protein